MKRIALLGFIVLIVPIIFAACCACGGCSDVTPWTYTGIENKLQKDSTTIYQEGDTITTDSIDAIVLLKSEISMFKPKQISIYSAMACGLTESGLRQNNYIFEWVFKLAIDGDILNADTIPSHLIELKIDNQSFNFQKDKSWFIQHFNNLTTLDKFEVKFPSPHNSKNIQLIILATKENLLVMRAVSQKVFCK